MDVPDHLNIIAAILAAILLILIILKLYNKYRGLTTKTDQNNQTHIIANAPNQEESVRLLAEIKSRLKYLINYCIENYPNNKNVKLLKKRFKPENVQEASLFESGTSYTLDKGKELHLCLRSKKHNFQHHDINTLMFVAIHELSHIMSVSYGHNSEFSENFKFLLEKAVECNLYVPTDYARNPIEFCGVTVETSPLYD